MSSAHSEPKLVFPGLAGFYASVADIWYPMIRIAVGGILLVHGWTKFTVGASAVAVQSCQRMGWNLVWHLLTPRCSLRRLERCASS